MKRNLGKFIKKCILLCSFVFLQAQDFSHTVHVDNTEPYVKEAVILTLELKQTNPNMVLMFNFDLMKSKDYSFQRLDTQETDIRPKKGLHHAKVKYRYLIYPLVSGKVQLHFKLLKKVTSDDSVAYSFSGDRDNVKGLVTKNYKIALPPLLLKVKALPKNTQIVGDFALDYKVQQHKADAFEPLPFQVTIKGLGYPPLLDLLPQDVNFTVFSEKPLVKSTITAQGTYSTVHYTMALSHAKSFVLDTTNIIAFNPKTEKVYKLSIPKQNFDIKEVSKTSLLDKVDNPKALKFDWSWLKNLFTYFIVFIAGYLTAISLKWTKKVQAKEENPLKVKIHNAKDTKALLQILLAHDRHPFKDYIEDLESALYGDGKINLSKVKKEIMELL